MTAVCNLADDLRDAIVEYQVSDILVPVLRRFTYGEVYSLHSRKRSTCRIAS